ncbi:MAG: hypothetical protein RL596_1930 [Bacteroidota bacterium]
MNALIANELSEQSILYIYSDGPTKNASEADIKNIEAVRGIIYSQKHFKQIFIVERESNMGLAGNIISGVTNALERYDKVIVLEDDIYASKGFLKYMNQALEMYEVNANVGCIHAWNYMLDTSASSNSTFFLRGADCWGWATWKRAWDLFEPNGKYLLEKIISKKLEYSFNRNGTHSFITMLEDQINGKNNSWAIRWHASLFLNDMYCLQPVRPIVKNIGLDGSGVHSGNTTIEQTTVDFIDVERIDVEESEWFFKVYSKMNKGYSRSSIWELLKNWAKKYYPLL